MADEVVQPKVTLNQTIENAATEVAKSVENVPEKPETKVEAKKETEPKSETVKQDDLDEKQLNDAKILFKALNSSDTKIQKETLRILAAAAGLDLKEIETKKDVAEAKEATLVELLREGLGEYDFLAEKFGPVLEKVMNKMLTESTKDIRERQAQDAKEKFESQINTAIDSAFAKFDNATEVKDEVVKLMDQFKPNGKLTHEEYFKSLIVLAASNKGITLRAVGSKEDSKIDLQKAAKNRLDAASRLASERGAEVKQGVRPPSKMNINDAVSQAAEEALKQLNK